jgi:hypothetical protein
MNYILNQKKELKFGNLSIIKKLKIKEFICSNRKILVLAQISIAKMDTPTQSSQTTDPCVSPNRPEKVPKTPGAPFKHPVFATRRNADDNAGGKRVRNFEKELDSVSDKKPKL